MPVSAPRKCTMVGCYQYVSDGSGRCAAHQYQKWQKRKDVAKRITGRRLQELREQLFRADPLCAECRRNDRITAATQRDHIVPLSEGGEDVPKNVQGLCDACHDAKSKAEAKRGRARKKSNGVGW
ncbi:HNH endonuclease [Undibacterium sp. CY22W]|uniref:HNH endonuclease n=1 Tax=Undibacterium curvum TaxID=2762294 RepID=A0ABR7A529_9BURK|nr:HNH endonuclease [Undibacterium curvum]